MAVAMYNDLDTCPEEEIFSPESLSWEKAAVASEATEALWFSTSTSTSTSTAKCAAAEMLSDETVAGASEPAPAPDEAHLTRRRPADRVRLSDRRERATATVRTQKVR